MRSWSYFMKNNVKLLKSDCGQLNDRVDHGYKLLSVLTGFDQIKHYLYTAKDVFSLYRSGDILKIKLYSCFNPHFH